MSLTAEPVSNTNAIEKRGGHHGPPPALKLGWDGVALQRGGEQRLQRTAGRKELRWQGEELRCPPGGVPQPRKRGGVGTEVGGVVGVGRPVCEGGVDAFCYGGTVSALGLADIPRAGFRRPPVGAGVLASVISA